MNNKAVIRVPATSANLGPGFDVVGMALDLFCEVSFDLSSNSFTISGCPREFANRENLAFVSFARTLQYKNIPIPDNLEIIINSDIPISRGLGSSSALIVAGIMAANLLYNLQLDKNQILLIATKIEGHPDNVAPCIYGGLVSSMISEEECFVIRHSISSSLEFALIIPDYKISTEKARSVLPNNITRQDAVFNIAHYGLLTEGFASGNRTILSEALNDKIHQPYRKEMISNFDRYQQIAKNCNAIGLVISGSGSTMLIVGDSLTDFDALQNDVDDALVKRVKPYLEGAICLTNI